jgi:hypothetical protein
VKWVYYDGEGHVVLREDGDDAIKTPIFACGEEAEPYNVEDVNALPEFREAVTVTERPFGADTHGPCHYIVKGWAANPDSAPADLLPKPVTAEQRRRMTAAERRAVVQGEPVSMEGDGAPAPEPIRPRRDTPAPVDVDDLEWPPEPGDSLPTAGGAVVVVPEARPKSRRSRRDPSDAEFDQ